MRIGEMIPTRILFEDLIDLKPSPEAIFENFGRRTRKKIRRGLRQGDIVIEEAADRGKGAACYNLLRQTYEAAQVPLNL